MSTTNEAQVTQAIPNSQVVFSINKPTPMWATMLFRAVFFLTTGATMWVAGTGKIKLEDKTEIMLILKAIDVPFWGMGRLLGVKKEEVES